MGSTDLWKSKVILMNDLENIIEMADLSSVLLLVR